MIDSIEVMKRANAAFEKSGLTLEEVGQKMGADPKTARMTVWQFLRRSTDPRLSMLLRFCESLELPIEDLLSEKKKSRAK
ncbi:MAG: XRE family transcriptional regulator [Gemmataceae bacterium]|nr:XRE family transcriptional regulator [Gemmataceae bacterium]